ncbi:30S ribosomal protein S5 [Candidatus Woesebacteria bacterium]|nr:30S ribosomal protein S5 [Candidatus Woesebacteria bacterium]
MKPEVKEFEEKVIQISRVSKKTKGGNKAGFSVLMVVGDKKGNVGVGLGKAKDVLSAIKKGVKKAKKKMISVPLDGTTIPFQIEVKKGAGRVLLMPAPKGSGVIAGGPVRAVVEAAGVRDISSKILGSENQASSVYATFEALKQIKKIVALKGIALKSIAEIESEETKLIQAEQEKAKKKSETRTESKVSSPKNAPLDKTNRGKTAKPKVAAKPQVKQAVTVEQSQEKGQ